MTGVAVAQMTRGQVEHTDKQRDKHTIVVALADTVVHGDATYMSIAAASVLAKTYRDDYMLRLHGEYPQYGWDRNKGYPTAEHYAALKQYGPTPYHRMTFNLKITKSEITNKKLEQ